MRYDDHWSGHRDPNDPRDIGFGFWGCQPMRSPPYRWRLSMLALTKPEWYYPGLLFTFSSENRPLMATYWHLAEGPSLGDISEATIKRWYDPDTRMYHYRVRAVISGQYAPQPMPEPVLLLDHLEHIAPEGRPSSFAVFGPSLYERPWPEQQLARPRLYQVEWNQTMNPDHQPP